MNVRAWAGEILVCGAKELPWEGYGGKRHVFVQVSTCARTTLDTVSCSGIFRVEIDVLSLGLARCA